MNGKVKMQMQGIRNARELGGYRTKDGGSVRFAALLRTAELSGMTMDDHMTLTKSYHVAHVVDFRSSFELAKSAEPIIGAAKNHYLPIMDEALAAQKIKPYIHIIMDPNVDMVVRLNALIDSGLIGDQMYVEYLRDDLGKKSYREFFKVLLENKEGEAVLWHCTNGKDRTGIAAMLILGVLGVDVETIVREFMLSNEFFTNEISKMREKLVGQVADSILEDCLVAGKGVSERYIRNVIAYLEKEYGGIVGYVSQALGISDEEICELKKKYIVSM